MLTRVPLEFVKPNMFYMDFFGQVDVYRPSVSGGFGMTMGGYVKRVNIEVSGSMGLEPFNAHVFMKTGYCIRLGRTVGLTPQIGLGWRYLDDLSAMDVDLDYGISHAMSLETSIRFTVGLFRCVSLLVVPEYGFAFWKSSPYEYMASRRSFINSWKHGFGMRIGFALNFDRKQLREVGWLY